MNTSSCIAALSSSALLVSIVLGCSAPDGNGAVEGDGNPSSGPGSSANDSGGTSDDGSAGDDGNPGDDGSPADDDSVDDISVDDLTPSGQSGDPRVENGLEVREEVCDEMGNCTCLNLALLGTFDSAASEADTDTSAFVDWLNDNSGGTAMVDMVTDKPTLDAAFLGQYDILIVANINAWTFSEAEKTAVAAWSDNGGGIVNLTGFDSTVTESAQSSQLIQFAGLGYSGTELAEATADGGQNVPVYYKDGTTDVKQCLHWNGITGNPQITTPIEFSPLPGTLEDLTFELDYVGAFIGWPVTAPESATVVATDPVSGGKMAVAHEPNGLGRVFAFGDEWVIFANQWEPTGTPHDTTEADHNVCYIPPESDVEPDERPLEEKYHSAKTVYQTKQFWYNAITWVAPPNECNFEITDTDVVVR